MAARARDALAVTLKDLLATGELSDFTIICGEDTYRVHGLIVHSRSGICSNAEVQCIRASTIRLPDGNRDSVKLMIDYLYEGEYEPKLPAACPTIFGSEPEFTGEVEDMEDGYIYVFPHTCGKGPFCRTKVCPHHRCGNHARNTCVDFVCRICCSTWIPPMDTTANHLMLHYQMYRLGKKYAVVGLSDLALEKFEQWCEKHWDDDYFLIVGDIAFSSTKDEQSLRDVVAKTVSNHMCLLNKPAVQGWMQQADGLAVGLVNLRAQDLGWIKTDAAK